MPISPTGALVHAGATDALVLIIDPGELPARTLERRLGGQPDRSRGGAASRERRAHRRRDGRALWALGGVVRARPDTTGGTRDRRRSDLDRGAWGPQRARAAAAAPAPDRRERPASRFGRRPAVECRAVQQAPQHRLGAGPPGVGILHAAAGAGGERTRADHRGLRVLAAADRWPAQPRRCAGRQALRIAHGDRSSVLARVQRRGEVVRAPAGRSRGRTN